ncbi:hypothetical protein C8J57DRAFT_1515909 [Mycena rebaudengoi]|nr:hypothetical protein C8J57DRAFT_1515909 [Mycena rebaudengoi]
MTVSADWVLPSALYRLCSLFSTNDLLDSFLELDGALSLPDLRLCLNAYTKLQTIELFRISRFLLPTTGGNCSTPETCSVRRARAQEYAPRRHNLPLHFLTSSDWDRLRVC